MSFLEISNVEKIYAQGEVNETRALKNITLEIQEGEFTVLSGPSGSGKTTLLNAIGGLDKMTSGTIVLKGERIHDLEENELADVRRNEIGFVFQAYNLVSVLSAFENIEYVMTLQGVSKDARKERVIEVAKLLGIEKLLDKKPNEMSGGQQQRVAVARAVASKPKLILADEPTANLDSLTAESLMDMMRTLNEKEGITIIFSSHDPLVVKQAKRLLVLKDGEIVDDKVFN
jgi:putative ABC transport system ATP-binding protein